jgi:hypothetical protein
MTKGLCIECGSKPGHSRSCYACVTYRKMIDIYAMTRKGAANTKNADPTPPFTYNVLAKERAFDAKTGKHSSIPRDVDVSDDGELVCLACRLANCEHIKAVLELGLDDMIFYFDTITVPMDLKHSVFVKFSLDTEVVADSRALRLHPDEGDVAQKAGVLCLLTRGEGRKVIRSVLLDWIKFSLLSGSPVCNQRTHGYHEQIVLDKHLQGKTIMPYVEAWSILRNRACTSCMEYSNKDTDDDLIPNPPKRGSKPPPFPGGTSASPRGARRVPLARMVEAKADEDELPF